MFATAMLLSALALGADDKAQAPFAEIAVEAKDRFSLAPGTAFAKPTEFTSAEAFDKIFADEPTRKRLGNSVDFQTHKLVVFSWRGSGQDAIDVNVAKTDPEQLAFTLVPGRTRDSRAHYKLYAVRNGVKYTAK